MHKYSSIREIDSKVLPGVKLRLKRLTEGRRTALRAALAEATARMRRISREMDAMAKLSPEEQDIEKLLEAQDRFDEIVATEVNPAWIRWGLASISGLEVDGEELGLDRLYDWPAPLFKEALETIRAEADMSAEERKNSELPSTSGELEVGSQNSTTASRVNGSVSSADETAGSISQN